MSELQDYFKRGELDPLPPGTASLYKTPWRSNPRTVSAFKALEGVGVYYKHIPNEWNLDDHIAVMIQLVESGVRRIRLAPHHAIYITEEWTSPREGELRSLRNELRAAKASGLRPCVVFVHIPPVGRAGTRELQEWWRQGELLPVGEAGSASFQDYLDKTYEALIYVVTEARRAGFTAPDSYDLEMGQGLWWGAPACPRPLPHTTVDALRPGGRIYEFDRRLCQRLRRHGFTEPTLWWGQTHHHFEDCSDEDVPLECAGRAISFYSAWSGVTTDGWLNATQYEKPHGTKDVWPLREPLHFAEGVPSELVLARPEGWMADRTRRDNLISLLQSSKTPIAMTSLGTVPKEIPDVEMGGLDGWRIKERGLTRSLAFWLNQGADFALLHSVYESGSEKNGEMTHSLIPNPIEPKMFQRKDAPPLRTLRAFCDGLNGAKPLEQVAELGFRFALEDDSVLIPGSGSTQPLRASDCLVLLPFQLDKRRYAVAAYVVSPNVACPLPPTRLTLEVDRRISDESVSVFRPVGRIHGAAEIVGRADNGTTVRFEVGDDVTWLRLSTE